LVTRSKCRTACSTKNGRPRAVMKAGIPTKVEIPNPKGPNPKGGVDVSRAVGNRFGICDLEFGIFLGFGIWDLGF
jgi:hypothetical protein